MSQNHTIYGTIIIEQMFAFKGGCSYEYFY